MRRRTINWILAGVTVASVLGLVLANPDSLVRTELCDLWCPRLENPQFWNALIYDLSVGAISSVIFYLLLVALPDAGRHRKLKRSLVRRYEEFRRECIMQLIWASGQVGVSMEQVDQLMKPQAFKDHFDGEPWYAAANAYNYDDGHRYLEDTTLAAQRFKAEVDYVLDQADIDDEDTFERLKILSANLERLTRATRDYDAVKSLFGDLWSIFTGWNFIDGEYGRDRVRELLEAI